MPSWPETYDAIDGISRELVQVHTKTAPMSAGPRPACSSAARAARNESPSRLSAV